MNPGCNWPSRQSWEFHGSAVIPTVIDNHALSVRLSEQVPNALETSYICLRNNVNLLQQEWHPAAAELLTADQSCPDHLKPPVIPQEPLVLFVMMAHISLQIPTALEPLNFWVFYGELFNRPRLGAQDPAHLFLAPHPHPGWGRTPERCLELAKTEDPEVLLQKGFSKLDPLNSSTMLHVMHKSS